MGCASSNDKSKIDYIEVKDINNNINGISQ